MIIFEYQCEKCGKIQDKWLKKSDENNKESCDKCGAESKYLVKLLSPQRVRHGSWSRWRV